MDDLYRDELLEHYKHPKNYGKLRDADVMVEERNASCGDEVKVYLKRGSGGKSDIKFEGRGCAVSVAFASMLIEHIRDNGLSEEDVVKLDEEKILEIVGLKNISPSRRKCAMLGLKAVKKAIKKLKR
jgi:nitrogen fixation protein NifU and related proteins